MAKSLKVSEDAWQTIYNRIAVDYPQSVLLIRDRMKSTLGFTVRRHTEYVTEYMDEDGKRSFPLRYTCIYLDFYNEPKRTMFLLKYGDLLDETRF